MQQHLTATFTTVAVSGTYDAATVEAVETLQAARGLPVTGTPDAATWQAALALPFRAQDWTVGT